MTARTSAYRLTTWAALIVAGLLCAPPATAQTAAPEMTKCAPTPIGDPFSGAMWNGWGGDTSNTRFQPAAAAGLTATDVPKLAGASDGEWTEPRRAVCVVPVASVDAASLRALIYARLLGFDETSAVAAAPLAAWPSPISSWLRSRSA